MQQVFSSSLNEIISNPSTRYDGGINIFKNTFVRACVRASGRAGGWVGGWEGGSVGKGGNGG